MGGALKRRLGRGLLAAAEAMPFAKPWLGRWGRRTRQEWFGGCVVRAQSRTGVRLRLASLGRNYLSFELFWRGLDYYEPLTTRLIHALAADAGQFLDVGANIGFHSLMLAARHPVLGITAFEPNPKLHALLTANIRANGFRHVTPEPVALSDRGGLLPFYLNQSDMSASLERGFEASHTGVVRVPADTLDGYLARRGASAGRLLLKVDVEGHEPAFFAGAAGTLRDRRPDIIAEAAVPYPPATLRLLRACGYRFLQITDEGLLPCAEPVAHVRGPLVFLNCLLTARPPAELEGISAGLRAHARCLDLHQTSKLADRQVVERLSAAVVR